MATGFAIDCSGQGARNSGCLEADSSAKGCRDTRFFRRSIHTPAIGRSCQESFSYARCAAASSKHRIAGTGLSLSVRNGVRRASLPVLFQPQLFLIPDSVSSRPLLRQNDQRRCGMSRVLVVEDERKVLRSLERGLQAEGYEVVT